MSKTPRQRMVETFQQYSAVMSGAGSLLEARTLGEDWARAQPDLPPVRRAPEDIAGVSVAWVTPEHGSDKDPVIIFLHGGGFAVGSVTTHLHMIAHLGTATRTRMLGVNYRLFPEHPFPAAQEDVVAVYRALLKRGMDPRRIAFAGDSAGGGLAVSSLLLGKAVGLPMPAAAALIGPWVDLAVTGASMVTNAETDPLVKRDGMSMTSLGFLGGVSPYHPLASPIYGDLSGLPPLLIQVGSGEALLDDARRLAGRANACGVAATLREWPDMLHGWHQFASFLPEARAALEEIHQFLEERPGWR
jgi:acetyl esterase/lipase